jgi:hypothetical protein
MGNDDIQNGESKGPSRKWRLVLLTVLLATLGAFLPPVISMWLMGCGKPLIILSGTEWVSVVTMVVGLYIGGNVYQKHIEHKSFATGISLNASVSASTGKTPDTSEAPETDESDEGKEA